MIRVEVPRVDAEIAADLLWAAGASAVEEAESATVGGIVLTADLDTCPEVVSERWRCRVEVDDGTWWDGWRPFARAARAGRFVVHPPWVDVTVGIDEIDLVVDAGRAFGTGSHPSTLLALAELARLMRPGATVLDVGCGSGVLAIGAALLAAGRVVAIDVDPAAIVATRANAEANDVVGAIEVSDRALNSVDERFDLVVANLGSPLVVELSDDLCARLEPGASLVLAGMLDDRWEHVVAAYPTLHLQRRTEHDGWCAVVLASP